MVAHGIGKFNGHDNEDVDIWLKQWTILKSTQAWNDGEAISHAVLNLGIGPFRWYCNNAANMASWDTFVSGMQVRYADDQQTLMLRLQHRTQQEDESVEGYADALSLLFLQTGFPVSAQRDMFLANLKPSLRKRVTNTCPDNLQEAIKKAIFLEAQDDARSPAKLQSLHQAGYDKPRRDKVEALADSVLALTGQLVGQAERSQANGRPVSMQRPKSHGKAHYAESGHRQARYQVPSDCNVPLYTFKGRYVDGTAAVPPARLYTSRWQDMHKQAPRTAQIFTTTPAETNEAMAPEIDQARSEETWAARGCQPRVATTSERQASRVAEEFRSGQIEWTNKADNAMKSWCAGLGPAQRPKAVYTGASAEPDKQEAPKLQADSASSPCTEGPGNSVPEATETSSKRLSDKGQQTAMVAEACVHPDRQPAASFESEVPGAEPTSKSHRSVLKPEGSAFDFKRSLQGVPDKKRKLAVTHAAMPQASDDATRLPAVVHTPQSVEGLDGQLEVDPQLAETEPHRQAIETVSSSGSRCTAESQDIPMEGGEATVLLATEQKQVSMNLSVKKSPPPQVEQRPTVQSFVASAAVPQGSEPVYEKLAPTSVALRARVRHGTVQSPLAVKHTQVFKRSRAGCLPVKLSRYKAPLAKPPRPAKRSGYFGFSSWHFPRGTPSFQFQHQDYAVISTKPKEEVRKLLKLLPHLELRYFPRNWHAMFSVRGGPWWYQVHGELCQTVGLPRVLATFPVHSAGPGWDIIKICRAHAHQEQMQRAKRQFPWSAVDPQGCEPGQQERLSIETQHKMELAEPPSNNRLTDPSLHISWDPGQTGQPI